MRAPSFASLNTARDCKRCAALDTLRSGRPGVARRIAEWNEAGVEARV